MARKIEYKYGKRYITDLKMGRSWRVPERKREKRGRGKGGKKKGPKAMRPPLKRKGRGDLGLTQKHLEKLGFFKSPQPS